MLLSGSVTESTCKSGKEDDIIWLPFAQSSTQPTSLLFKLQEAIVQVKKSAQRSIWFIHTLMLTILQDYYISIWHMMAQCHKSSFSFDHLSLHWLSWLSPGLLIPWKSEGTEFRVFTDNVWTFPWCFFSVLVFCFYISLMVFQVDQSFCAFFFDQNIGL